MTVFTVFGVIVHMIIILSLEVFPTSFIVPKAGMLSLVSVCPAIGNSVPRNSTEACGINDTGIFVSFKLKVFVIFFVT